MTRLAKHRWLQESPKAYSIPWRTGRHLRRTLRRSPLGLGEAAQQLGVSQRRGTGRPGEAADLL